MKPAGEKTCPRCGKAYRAHGTLCWACRKRQWRAEHPLHSAWLVKKWNAGLDGWAFTLTPAQWESLWESAPALPGGCAPDCLTVDRIDPRCGYEPGNVQILSMHDNASKKDSLDGCVGKFNPF